MSAEAARMTFDQLQRYRLAAELIEATRRDKPLLILDAASHQGSLKSFLPEDNVLNLDKKFFSAEDFIQADVFDLPFPDGSLDVVLALDVVEHLPPGERISFLDELARVSKDVFIMGSPFRDEKVEEAERLAGEFFKKVTGREHEFLAEHRVLGLPRLDEVLQWSREKGYQNLVLPNGFLGRWLLMICFNFYLARMDDPWNFIFAINRFYNNEYYRADNASPSYRQLVLASKKGSFDPEEIRSKISLPLAAEEVPDLKSVMHEFNRILDFTHRETVSQLTQEKEQIRKERDDIRDEKDRISVELHHTCEELREVRTELNGLKSTFAYRLYKKTLGRFKKSPLETSRGE